MCDGNRDKARNKAERGKGHILTKIEWRICLSGRMSARQVSNAAKLESKE